MVSRRAGGVRLGKDGDGLGLRNIHARTALRTVHRARVLQNRRHCPELPVTSRTLDFDDFHQ